MGGWMYMAVAGIDRNPRNIVADGPHSFKQNRGHIGLRGMITDYRPVMVETHCATA